MLEAMVKQLEKHTREDFRCNESFLARLVPFMRKEAAEKEAAEQEPVEKEAAEKEDDDDEEDQ
jgi:hypothetical protein